MPQLIHAGRLSRCHALRKLHEPADSAFTTDRVLRGNSLDLDHADPRVVGPAVMLPVAEIPDPCLKRGRVVLVDLLAVGLDGRLTRDGGPLARGLEEGEVDFGV